MGDDGEAHEDMVHLGLDLMWRRETRDKEVVLCLSHKNKATYWGHCACLLPNWKQLINSKPSFFLRTKEEKKQSMTHMRDILLDENHWWICYQLTKNLTNSTSVPHLWLCPWSQRRTAGLTVRPIAKLNVPDILLKQLILPLDFLHRLSNCAGHILPAVGGVPAVLRQRQLKLLVLLRGPRWSWVAGQRTGVHWEGS